jgi:hypothetical protein
MYLAELVQGLEEQEEARDQLQGGTLQCNPARALFGSSVMPVYSEKYLFAHPSASHWHIPPAWKLGLNCPCLRLDMAYTVHCAIVLPAVDGIDAASVTESSK